MKLSNQISVLSKQIQSGRSYSLLDLIREKFGDLFQKRKHLDIDFAKRGWYDFINEVPPEDLERVLKEMKVNIDGQPI